jgi:hypothetical protein
VSDSAGQNEECKSIKHPTELNIGPFGDKVRQRERDGKIGQRDDCVGTNVELSLNFGDGLAGQAAAVMG